MVTGWLYFVCVLVVVVVVDQCTVVCVCSSIYTVLYLWLFETGKFPMGNLGQLPQVKPCETESLYPT